MTLADIDANGWALIIAAVCYGVGDIITKLATLIAAKRAAQKVEEVKTTLEVSAAKQEVATAKQDAKLEGMAAVGKRTELYCNSALGRALRLAAIATAAQAEGSKDPQAIAAAAAAQKELRDHEAKQQIADAEDAGMQ